MYLKHLRDKLGKQYPDMTIHISLLKQVKCLTEYEILDLTIYSVLQESIIPQEKKNE